MPHPAPGPSEADGPSAVGLTRLSRRPTLPSGGEALYRHILRLVELGPEQEFVVVPCGAGAGALFVAAATGAAGAGADDDPALVDLANQRAKAAGHGARLHFETAPLDELPYQDAVFDLALGEIELGTAGDPVAAARELVRVTRPGGTVVLVQLVWTRALEPEQGAALVEKLGVRPQLLVEWKQALRSAGIKDLVVEDWSDAAASQERPSVLGGLAELFTVRGRLRLLPRAWQRWGWKGVLAVLSRERELRQPIQEERVLGASLIKGTRAGNGTEQEGGAT